MARTDLQNLQWAIGEELDDEGVGYYRNGRTVPLTRQDLDQLDRPISLKTPHLVLNLPPSRYGDDTPVIFNTPNVVSHRIILGAIKTYYNQALTLDDIAGISERDGGPPLIEVRSSLQQGRPAIRLNLMSSRIFFEGITENSDGSFDVHLGS